MDYDNCRKLINILKKKKKTSVAGSQFRFSLQVLLFLPGSAGTLSVGRPGPVLPATGRCGKSELSLHASPPWVYSWWLQGCLALSVACVGDKNWRIVLSHYRYDAERRILFIMRIDLSSILIQILMLCLGPYRFIY